METVYENRGGEVWERHPDGRRELFAEDIIRKLTTLERERNEAREAYEAETLSTADLMADNARLERIVKDLNDANRVLFESKREAAESADEKPDGQAENDKGDSQSPAKNL